MSYDFCISKLDISFLTRKSVKFVQEAQTILLIFNLFQQLKLYRNLYLQPLFFELGLLGSCLFRCDSSSLLFAEDNSVFYLQNKNT